jgi:hypothetical protein
MRDTDAGIVVHGAGRTMGGALRGHSAGAGAACATPAAAITAMIPMRFMVASGVPLLRAEQS